MSDLNDQCDIASSRGQSFLVSLAVILRRDYLLTGATCCAPFAQSLTPKGHVMRKLAKNIVALLVRTHRARNGITGKPHTLRWHAGGYSVARRYAHPSATLAARVTRGVLR